ncbi:MAG: hypothetical protein JO112_17205, partial [Planctomycetes bacterium]|nr:hypothetical protein [Planctomycetota bacterium]
MARSFQQQSLTRKLVYLSLIVVLFFVTLVLKKQVVTAKAEELGLREKNQGEVELTGSALRLTLTGSRGLVVCYLWNESLDMQMKHEVNRLDLLIRALTKLQPHFVTPWLFQSWTLAYNISRDAQNLPDKYYYIASGTQLLAEGIRQNQEIPELRYNVGIYYRDKIGQSDDNLALQSFVQMSCIDPVERDPARFRPNPNNRRDLDWVQLQRFCEAHPFLIRRLYDGLGRKTPQEVIDFLEANQKIVSRFAETSEGGVSPLRPPAERYPILPATPPQPPFEQELTNDSELRDDFTGYTALRAWWSYAQDPLSLPHFRPPPGALVIFQQGPARAQAYIGEQLEEEGWFDETPWPIADWFPEDPLQPEG